MHPALHIVRLATRASGIGNIFSETRAATRMFYESFFQDIQLPNLPNYPPPRTIAIFVPGFLAYQEYYRRFFIYLYCHGILPIAPLGLARNTASPRFVRECLSVSVSRIEDAFGTVPDFITHSKGGPDALGILGERPEISKAVFTAGPFRGASLFALKAGLSFFTNDTEHIVDEDVLEDETVLEKIYTIASIFDRIVTPPEAHIIGAQANIVLSETSPETDNTWNSHAGLPYHARKEIVNILTSSNAAA